MAVNATTLSIAIRRWRVNRATGEPKPTLFAWIQLRNEAILFAVLLICGGTSVYRLIASNPDPFSCTGRILAVSLITLLLTLNRRDFKKL